MYEKVTIMEGRKYELPYFKRSFWGIIKPFVYLSVVLVCLFSLIYWQNYFMKLPVLLQILYVILILKVFCDDPCEWKPSELELLFYIDRLVVYREKAFWSKRMIHKEIATMYFKDPLKVEFHKNICKIYFLGKIEKLSYAYNRNGELKETPYYNKTVENGNVWIYPKYSDPYELIQLIEEKTPWKIQMEEK